MLGRWWRWTWRSWIGLALAMGIAIALMLPSIYWGLVAPSDIFQEGTFIWNDPFPTFVRLALHLIFWMPGVMLVLLLQHSAIRPEFSELDRRDWTRTWIAITVVDLSIYVLAVEGLDGWGGGWAFFLIAYEGLSYTVCAGAGWYFLLRHHAVGGIPWTVLNGTAGLITMSVTTFMEGLPWEFEWNGLDISLFSVYYVTLLPFLDAAIVGIGIICLRPRRSDTLEHVFA